MLVHALVSYCDRAHGAVHAVYDTPLQYLSAGQAAHTRLVVAVHAMVSYCDGAHAAVQDCVLMPLQ